jgi:hypothetical protein
MSRPFACACGALRGEVAAAATTVRGVCYCRDCRAYARFLGTPGVTDALGGTEVVATLPNHVRFTAGLDRLACMSLKERGLLRWYASCCNTPIANTPRNPRIAYAGLVHSCLDHAASLDASFGRKRIIVNTDSVKGQVRATPVSTVLAVANLMARGLVARMTGAARNNPFFLRGTRTPIRTPRVLSKEERERAYGSIA